MPGSIALWFRVVVGLLSVCVVALSAIGQPRTSPPTRADARAAEDFFETYPDGSQPAPARDIGESPLLATGLPTGGLAGRIIFTSGGHGWTYANGNTNRTGWYTQRGATHEMIEDYGNLDQMTMFAAYCFHAGASVVPLRPVGFQTNEVVLDNDDAGVHFRGQWAESRSTIYYGSPGDVPYKFAALSVSETATATYTPDIPVSGFYPVYTWVRHGSDRTSQLYRLNHTGGQATVRVAHQMVGNGWVYLGTYYFAAGRNPAKGAVIISNLQPAPAFGSVAIADAIRFGNGMGDIVPIAAGAEKPTISGYPREEECARYWIQAGLGQGQTSNIYDGPGDDGSDNVGAPPRMARNMNRESAGNLYKRVFVSFHSNASGSPSARARGCVGLHNNESLFPGTRTPNQFRLAELVAREVNDDLVALSSLLEVPWVNRSNRLTYAREDYAFGEINNRYIGNEFDATIIEVAFHDNADDAKLLRDPKVRDWLARATYQAVVRYMNEFDAAILTFLPDPPINVRATATDVGGIAIAWNAPNLEHGGGKPAGYRIYRSADGYGFGNPVEVSGEETLSVTLTGLPAERDFYFRVTALNAGGESLPSATVDCRRATPHPLAEKVLFVNAFDRFDRTLEVRQTVGPGLGSAGNKSRTTIGRIKPREINSFDYVVQHGRALSASGVAFDSCQNEAVVGGEINLLDYPMVIWACGQESVADQTFDPEEQARVTAYLSAGGNLFVSGSEIAWDLDRSPRASEADRAFLNRQLRSRLVDDAHADSQSHAFAPAEGSIFAGRPPGGFDDGTQGIYCVQSPDVLTAVGPGAEAALRYVGGRGGAAAVQYDSLGGGGKVVCFGFPFETISDPGVREAYLRDMLGFFGTFPVSQLATPQVSVKSDVVTLTWNARAGGQYQVQYKKAMRDPLWLNVGASIRAKDSRVQFRDAAARGQRVYRVLSLN